VSVAAGATRLRATFADFFSAGHDLHFRQSRIKLLGLCVLCVAMTATLAALGHDFVPNGFSQSWHLKFRLMAPLFGLVTLVPLWLLAKAHQRGIVLTRTGVTDHRISAQEIPWLAIDAVSEGRHFSSHFVVLRLADARDAPRSILQDLNSLLLGLSANERTVSAAGLDVSHGTLVEAILAAWRAARERGPAADARRAS
jgi:hypothetical protein